MSNFMEALKSGADSMQPNVSVTENGAVGYQTTGKKLVDLNFMLSSMRNMEESEIYARFLEAYNEDPTLATVWLFFARDPRGGCGERRTFRAILPRLANENPSLVTRLLPLIPEYGRWDDLVDLYCAKVPREVSEKALKIIATRWEQDLSDKSRRKPISLLAKWLPSQNATSKETRLRAALIRNALGLTPAQYRKQLSALRAYLDVVERKMSASDWENINYSAVPSRAALNYREAFRRHDGERYDAYLNRVQSGEEKINAGVLFPYDIVHAYMQSDGHWTTGVKEQVDPTLEAQWQAIPNYVKDGGSTLVVVDGSGSMETKVGKTGVSCHDVARSLGIYFAERLAEPFRNSFITFSADPQFIYFKDGLTLNAKLRILERHDECSNTDLEKVFNLILSAAVANHLRQDELPANILIVSDGEFDAMTCRYESTGGYGWKTITADGALFTAIADRFAAAGYKLPRLVFWNVCSRTGTIPLTENEMGVALVSGFSPSIADMVLSGDLDPFHVLRDRLQSDRYKPVFDAMKE